MENCAQIVPVKVKFFSVFHYSKGNEPSTKMIKRRESEYHRHNPLRKIIIIRKQFFIAFGLLS